MAIVRDHVLSGRCFDSIAELDAAFAGSLPIRRAQVHRTHGQQIAVRAVADRAVIVLGDLNDTPEAATSQLLLGPGGCEIGTRGEKLPDKGDAWRLWAWLPRSRRRPATRGSTRDVVS